MNSLLWTLRFLTACLVQVFIFNEFLFSGYLNPYVYVLFILWLPTSIARSRILLIAFAMGLIIDLFEGGGGLHAAASVLLAFVRPYFIRIISNRMDESREEIKLRELNWLTLSTYTLAGLFLHHLALFSLEQFSFQGFGTVLVRTFYSTLFSYLFVLFIQLWTAPKRRQ